MAVAKNRPLLLLFVPGSSRASVRLTATDDREDLTIPPSLSLSSSFTSAALHVTHLAVHLWTSAFSPLPLTQFCFLELFVLGLYLRFCPTVFRDRLTNRPELTSLSLCIYGSKLITGGVLRRVFCDGYLTAYFPLVLCFCLDFSPKKKNRQQPSLWKLLTDQIQIYKKYVVIVLIYVRTPGLGFLFLSF